MRGKSREEIRRETVAAINLMLARGTTFSYANLARPLGITPEAARRRTEGLLADGVFIEAELNRNRYRPPVNGPTPLSEIEARVNAVRAAETLLGRRVHESELAEVLGET